ncbi:MAG TPA: tryptophan synthase subunit alpha [Chloroflexota bacterium]|nr:tryptophan synthase subunit alpha [Chloroflexota bacterium]
MTALVGGKSRIGATIARVRAAGGLALIGWQTVGYPQKGDAQRLVPGLIEGGFDLIELGVPFSDPQADGATVQRATHGALQNGTTPADCFQAVRDLRQGGVTAPLIFLSYYNPVLAVGLERFAALGAEAGLDGLIVPDLPVEESDDLLAALEPAGIDPIFLVAPTSTEDRLAAVAARARGFVYCVSLAGVTGARRDLAAGLPEYLARVRRATDLPLAVGFGVSRPEHVAALREHADAAIVASAILDLMDRTAPDEQETALRGYAGALREAAGPR